MEYVVSSVPLYWMVFTGGEIPGTAQLVSVIVPPEPGSVNTCVYFPAAAKIPFGTVIGPAPAKTRGILFSNSMPPVDTVDSWTFVVIVFPPEVIVRVPPRRFFFAGSQ
jgi:hypothetical protein